MKDRCLLSRRALLAGSLASVSAVSLRAAQVETPEALVARALRSLQRKRFAEFAACLHPAGLKSLRQMAALNIRMAETAGNNPYGWLALPGADQADQPGLRDEIALAAAYLGSNLPRRPVFKEQLGLQSAGVVGHCRAAPDLAHVVYRRRPNSRPGNGGWNVVTLRKSGAEWCLCLSLELEFEVMLARVKYEAGPHAPMPELRRLPTEIVGHVPDGPSAAYIVARSFMQVDNYRVPSWIGMPIRKGDPGWDLLAQKNYAALTRLAQEKTTGRRRPGEPW